MGYIGFGNGAQGRACRLAEPITNLPIHCLEFDVISQSLKLLLNRAGRIRSVGASSVLGVIVALSAPILAVLAGAILGCLMEVPVSDSQTVSVGFARLLPDPNQVFSDETAILTRIASLLAIAAIVVVLTSIGLFAFYKQVQRAAVVFEVTMIDRLRKHAKGLARVRTLSAQQQALVDGLDYHLPRVRSSLSRWWRSFPRHAVQLIGCLVIAVLIEPALALLTLIATAVILLVYRYLDRSRRTVLPVVRERAGLQREILVDLSVKGPLLESVHEEHEVERRFAEQMAHYQRDAVRSLSSSIWKTPMIVLIGGLLICLFLFVIAVQIILGGTDFGLPGAFTFTLCCVGAAVSLVRFQRALRELRTVETAAEEMERFLALPVEDLEHEELKQIQRVTKQAALEHVTVQDSRGRKLLENISVVFTPGCLFGVVASQPLQGRALVELLLGFGRPVSGRMLVDDEIVTDLRPDSLAHCAHWVAADGALVTGTLTDNLLGPAQQVAADRLDDVVNATRLKDVLQHLPDGYATIISPGDDRLAADAPFRIGVARAALRDASIVVVEEPKSSNYDQEGEQLTLETIRSLVGPNRITVVLPQRLGTLRECDVVIMIHDHKVADVGSHADLLQRNELYRHLNYLKFNPFRNL